MNRAAANYILQQPVLRKTGEKMRFWIKHDIKGRMRVHVQQKRMTFEQANKVEFYLKKVDGIHKVKVYERTADITIDYTCSRDNVIWALQHMRYENIKLTAAESGVSGRMLNAEFQEKLVMKVVLRMCNQLFVPVPVRNIWTCLKSVKYIKEGISCLAKRRLDVPVLDATAIGVSIVRGSYSTAGSTMFLLGIGEILEEWTHKKSVDDLARSMSLNISKVWLKVDGQEMLVSASEIRPGDYVVVHMGNVIPFDGEVSEGEAMVNQSSLTGESVAVKKGEGSYVYAGTVLEEGELIIRVRETSGSTKYEKIVGMIEESEKLKSALESKAEHLADQLVPYTLFGTGLVWLATRNATKALAVLMVDFSCALKLSVPIAVLSAIREAGDYSMTVKGGKYLEAVAEAKTIVFDKTGTLTKAKPTVAKVVPFCDMAEDELLRIAACMEEHFPHSMAKAVVQAAKDRHLEHDEMHSKVEYLVAHGIATTINGKKVVIGSYHFVFEDEGCRIADAYIEEFHALPSFYSHLYMAVEQQLAAVICIEDPLRPEACQAIGVLRDAGIDKIVMMTGDSERTAAAIAAAVGVDEYYSEVLPEDKANFIEKEKAKGRKVIMVGDGINDSPALSAADVGVAISDGAEIAREIADITVAADDLNSLVTLKQISNLLMKRIRRNYRNIVTFNAGLIVFGVGGLLQPTTSALLHNTSTLVISLQNMKNLIDIPRLHE